MLFGFIMLVSIVRFALRGWIYDLYVLPTFHFTYYGFEWIQPPGAAGMYAIFALMGLAALAIMVGWQYRAAAVLFFITFTYVELIDKTNYLNHYYFVSIISFLLLLVPAHRSFSLDVVKKPSLRRESVPAWTINIFKAQLGIVYFFAGLAKLNADWLFEAMPLRLWLPAFSHLPIAGPLFQLPETALVFSWAGAFYDLTIVFFLLTARTRPWAYAAVVVFHLITALLFQIGMFPYIMILCTLIYFSASFHEQCLSSARRALRGTGLYRPEEASRVGSPSAPVYSPSWPRVIAGVLALHFTLQLVLPLRFALYPDNLFWTEEGYRFSWRVMLMEKAGYTAFRVRDLPTNRSWEVANYEYLTPTQEKMMATQPDMILQFAHYLDREYEKQGLRDVVITADSYVTMNGRRSRRFIDPAVDLTRVERSLKHKNWVLTFDEP